MKILLVAILGPLLVQAIGSRDLYSYINEPSEILPRGDEEFAEVKLDTPAHFYSEKYDTLYVREEILPAKIASERVNEACGYQRFLSVS